MKCVICKEKEGSKKEGVKLILCKQCFNDLKKKFLKDKDYGRK
jgi:hypothetical protein